MLARDLHVIGNCLLNNLKKTKMCRKICQVQGSVTDVKKRFLKKNQKGAARGTHWVCVYEKSNKLSKPKKNGGRFPVTPLN